MSYKRKVLLIGNSNQLKPFISIIRGQGIEVATIESITEALEVAKKTHPNAIVFIVPVYWEPITHFVEEIRKVEGFSETPIIYMGSIIEGEDQRILQKYDVKVLTLGPVANEEVARFIAETIPY